VHPLVDQPIGVPLEVLEQRVLIGTARLHGRRSYGAARTAYPRRAGGLCDTAGWRSGGL
jgi:hypothetical protein